MFTTHDDKHRSCDGVSRRSFLKAGSLGMGGLMFADPSGLMVWPGSDSESKALINIHLPGGPSHQDMWDLKPDAPSIYRGEFNPISTNVPGMQICELFPRLAKMADRFVVVRGLVGSVNEHSSNTVMTGYGRKSLESLGGRPSIGAVVSRMSQESSVAAPPFVSLMGSVTPGYLGPIHQPFVPSGRGRENLKANVGAERLSSRVDLLGKLDGLRRDTDASGKMKALDSFTQRAVDLITSGRVAKALDVDREDGEALRRYVGSNQGRYRDNRNLLVARRLVEAGVRSVALRWGGWDTHSNNFKTFRTQLPALDVGLSNLLDDLQDRRMLDDVTIAVWGEFGRTPKVNSKAGRDHWPRVAAAWIAGGGMSTGQVIGASDRTASEAVEAIHVQQVHSTLYHNLGIDVKTAQFIDPAGRPQYLLDMREPIAA